MGLFSTTKTFIESSSQILLEETPNLVKDTIITSVLNNKNIPNELVGNYIGSLYIKGRRMRQYAIDKYPLGLPEGTLNYPAPNNQVMKPILEQDLGITVLVVSTVIDIASATRFILPYLTNVRGWDSNTNIVSNPPFTPPVNASPVEFNDAYYTSDTQTSIEYVYTVQEYDPSTGNTEINTYYYTEIYTHDPVQRDNLYYYVVYFETETTTNEQGEEEEVIVGEQQYWSYDPSTHVYPSLDIPEDLEQSSQYYPVIPIRRSKVDLTQGSYREDDLFKTSKRMLDMWGIDIDGLAEGINASPDIGDVDHAYVITAVDIADDSQAVLNYLYEYFIYLSNTSEFDKNDYDNWVANSLDANEAPPVNIISIRDFGYRMNLSYNYIQAEVIQGSIGDVDTFEREVIATERDVREFFAYETSKYIIRKQLTTNFYQEITVHGLYHINYVYPNDTVDTSLKDAFDTEDEKNNFLIPLNVDVTDNVSRLFSNELMYYSIRIVFNSKIKKKIKWYETGFFQFFIKVVAIVLTVYGLYQVGQALIAAAAVGVVAVAQVIIQAVLISIAVNYALDFLVNVIGLEGALIVILAIAAAAYTGNIPEIGSIASYELPTAIDFLQVTNVALQEYENIVQDEVQAVIDEINEFLTYAEELTDELEEEERDSLLDFNSLDIVRNSMRANETPEEFIFRTTYNDNIGVLALEGPSTFVEKLLRFDIPTNDINLEI